MSTRHQQREGEIENGDSLPAVEGGRATTPIAYEEDFLSYCL